MNKRPPYNNMIERKLGQLPLADADHLWNDMHSILDKKMPQRKERRRFIVWLLSGKGPLLLTIVFLFIIGFSLFFLSTKENSAITIKKSPASRQSTKFIEDGAAKISRRNKEKITAAIEANQKTWNITSAAASSANGRPWPKTWHRCRRTTARSAARARGR